MKKRIIIIISLFLIIGLINSCGNNDSTEVVNNGRTISVKAMVIKPTDIQISSSFTGSVEGEQQAVIYSKIAEAVEKVNVSEGAEVKAGEVLINLDKSGPSSNYYQARSVWQNSEKIYKKMEYLYNEGAVSETDFDASKTQYEVNQASYEAASKLVNIETPISGIVTSLDVSAGDFVQIGQKMATIATVSNLRVKFNVNASEIKNFKKGAEVIVKTEENTIQTKGSVVAVASSADPSTRSFEVEVLLDNRNNLFRPGMFVRIIFVKETLENVIAVPRKSILTLNNVDNVFVVSNGVVSSKKITIGEETEGQVVITSGLNVNDTLVTLGQEYLGDSTKVRITELIEGVK